MSYAHPRLVDDVFRAIADRSWVRGSQSPPFWLDGSEGCDDLIVQNGIVNIRTGELRPHDSALFALTAAGFKFDPAATCPRIDEWLRTFTCGRESLTQLVLEMLAYSSLPSLQRQKFFLMIGRGGNAKQTLLRLLTMLVGGNTSAVPLESLKGRFALAGMIGKNCNLVADLNTDLNTVAEGRLKELSDGSAVQFEEKYKPTCTVVMQTKLIFCSNSMIRFKDKSNGIWRRCVVIPCDYVVPDDQKVYDYESELVGELPGLLNRVIAAGQRLVERGDFDLPECCTKLLNQFRIEQDSAKEFCQTHLVRGTDSNFVPSIDVYHEYRHWVLDRGGVPVGFPNFWHTFGDVWKKEKDENVIYYTKRECEQQAAWGKKALARRRVAGWAGVRLIDPDCEEIEETSPVVTVAVPNAVPKVAAPAPALAASVTLAEDVDHLLDELKECDGYGNATWDEYRRQLPSLLADADAQEAEQRVVELRDEMERKVMKAEQEAKELAEKAELERKKVAYSESV